jgi:hypothetical protein
LHLTADILLLNLKGTCSLIAKNSVYGLNQNMWFIHINGMDAEITDSQSADSGNRPASILFIAGISFQLQFQRSSSNMPISAISQ